MKQEGIDVKQEILDFFLI